MPDVPTQYSRRHRIALERPELHDRRDVGWTNDPHKRKVFMVEHAKKKIQLVTALTVDLDDWPEWHASVMYLDENPGAQRSFPIERRLWSDEMQQRAIGEMRKLMRLPYEVQGVLSRWATRDRPSEWHCYWKVLPVERDKIIAILCGTVQPTVYIKDPRAYV